MIWEKKIKDFNQIDQIKKKKKIGKRYQTCSKNSQHFNIYFTFTTYIYRTEYKWKSFSNLNSTELKIKYKWQAMGYIAHLSNSIFSDRFFKPILSIRPQTGVAGQSGRKILFILHYLRKQICILFLSNGTLEVQKKIHKYIFPYKSLNHYYGPILDPCVEVWTWIYTTVTLNACISIWPAVPLWYLRRRFF